MAGKCAVTEKLQSRKGMTGSHTGAFLKSLQRSGWVCRSLTMTRRRHLDRPPGQRASARRPPVRRDARGHVVPRARTLGPDQRTLMVRRLTLAGALIVFIIIAALVHQQHHQER